MRTKASGVALALAAGCGDGGAAPPWMPAQTSGGTAQTGAATATSTTGEPDDGDSDGPAATSGASSDGDRGDTAANDTGSGSEGSTGEPVPPVDPPPFLPLYRIATRVHLTTSGLTDDEVLDYLTEMNLIWRSQAGICFEFEVVDHDAVMELGFDMWFQPMVMNYNGVYYNDHEIFVRDYPSLGNAPNPAMFPGARTAAHELGHALTLAHDQASDDYLMRSGTHGWQLPDYQIEASRDRAADKAEADTEVPDCGPPVFR